MPHTIFVRYNYNCMKLLFLQEIGCDDIIGSIASVDTCGVCGGDGSSCTVVTSPTHVLALRQNTLSIRVEESPDVVTSLARDSPEYFSDTAAANINEESFDSVLYLDEVPDFLWQETPFGTCSVTCGEGQNLVQSFDVIRCHHCASFFLFISGVERTSIICKSFATFEQVPDSFCASLPKPRSKERSCQSGVECPEQAR